MGEEATSATLLKTVGLIIAIVGFFILAFFLVSTIFPNMMQGLKDFFASIFQYGIILLIPKQK